MRFTWTLTWGIFSQFSFALYELLVRLLFVPYNTGNWHQWGSDIFQFIVYVIMQLFNLVFQRRFRTIVAEKPFP